jgi:hypothetical protein
MKCTGYSKGIAIVQSGGAISVGSPLQAFDDGTAIVQDSGPLEGYAMDAASGAYQLIRILLVLIFNCHSRLSVCHSRGSGNLFLKVSNEINIHLSFYVSLC